MSSALAMVLMAAMAIPGNGPERVSGEVKRARGLDIDGKWEGVGWSTGEIWWAEVNDRNLTIRCVFGERTSPDCKAMGLDHWDLGEIKGKGDGNLNLVKNLHRLDQEVNFGIYRWDGDRLIICFSPVEYGRPESFQPGKMQWLLILHRAKPGK